MPDNTFIHPFPEPPTKCSRCKVVFREGAITLSVKRSYEINERVFSKTDELCHRCTDKLDKFLKGGE